jgi:hypothetical protein
MADDFKRRLHEVIEEQNRRARESEFKLEPDD